VTTGIVTWCGKYEEILPVTIEGESVAQNSDKTGKAPWMSREN